MSRHAKRILIVDDEPDIRFALTIMLQDAGYIVETLALGEDLMQHLHTGEAPDLILLDMLLAGLDGRAIARKLKAEPRTRHIPILMISARPQAKQEAADAGADAFIAKPFDLEMLLEKIAAYLT
jgi:two-component system, OmpR family, phosphate regulon response regulator PhoB